MFDTHVRDGWRSSPTFAGSPRYASSTDSSTSRRATRSSPTASGSTCLAKAVASLACHRTLVQRSACRSRYRGKISRSGAHGSGKTAALGLPTVQKVLTAKEKTASDDAFRHGHPRADAGTLRPGVRPDLGVFYYCQDKVSVIGSPETPKCRLYGFVSCLTLL